MEPAAIGLSDTKRASAIACQVLRGDALDQLRTLPAESVQCCVTSPPYWLLRDYGMDGQIGLEPTLT